MTEMDEMDFADMVEQTPVDSYVIEYREPSENGIPGRLVGACLTDRQGDGLSMIYSFFDPYHDTRPSLGNYIIMDHILRAARAGLPYVYLGYWVEGSKRMQYKIRYRPLERLSKNGWVRFDPDEQQGLNAFAPYDECYLFHVLPIRTRSVDAERENMLAWSKTFRVWARRPAHPLHRDENHQKRDTARGGK